jgi:hypothetical protein
MAHNGSGLAQAVEFNVFRFKDNKACAKLPCYAHGV